MASRLDQYVDQASAFAQENKRAVTIVGITAVAATSLYLLNRRNSGRVPTSGPYPPGSLPADAYDLVIVGAGPSGSTTAFFSAKAGLKVALLEKESFPRDKYCGDAVCTPAINILTEMGVMQELQDNNEAHFADAGGFVSPAGISYIGRFAMLSVRPQCKACSNRRHVIMIQVPLWKSWVKLLHVLSSGFIWICGWLMLQGRLVQI